VTDRERELLCYVGQLLELSRRQGRLLNYESGTWQRINDATREDRKTIAVEAMLADGWAQKGDAWTYKSTPKSNETIS